MAKAASWVKIDAEARKRGEQTGLDTLVVHALKRCQLDVGFIEELSVKANALS